MMHQQQPCFPARTLRALLFAALLQYLLKQDQPARRYVVITVSLISAIATAALAVANDIGSSTHQAVTSCPQFSALVATEDVSEGS